MQCREFMQYAERWMDGERDAHASAHVKSCANCSALVADLETISHSAMELREAEPPARVWVSLRNQLESEGVIRETAAVAVAEPSRSAMQCGEFLRYAERWMDGERDALAAAHLKACANCSALVSDLESISSSAVHLSEAEPPARVWVSLRNQLEAEGVIREAVAAAVESPRPRIVFGLRPAFASLFVALFVLAGSYLALRSNTVVNTPANIALTDPSRDGSEVMAELAALAKAPMPQIHEHNPVVAAAYKQNLEIVDNAIAMCEKTVKDQPRNEVAMDYLRAAYQQKADLLASMSQRGALGD